MTHRYVTIIISEEKIINLRRVGRNLAGVGRGRGQCGDVNRSMLYEILKN